ncbi:MAG: maleate cis-trans isomerase [Candidatus Aramenus sp.]|nr:maleate cis-trans isomerase [Candidatus Aramenus sp.]
MLSLIVSEENTVLPRDIETAFKDVQTIYMKYYPGHGNTRAERIRMTNELLSVKGQAEKGDVIVYARSYGVFYEEGMREIRRIFSKPVVISTEAIIKRLRALGAKDLFLVTPYNQKRHEYEIKWLRDFGFNVIGSIALGRTGGKAIASTPHELVVEAVRVAQMSSADAIYVACTILSTLPILEELKGRIDVVTAASAIVDEVKKIVNLGNHS